MTAALTIDVHFDLICPWCLIGKRNLDTALARFAKTDPDTEVSVRWHSVQLLPDIPEAGWDFHAFYLQRLGGINALRQRQSQVVAAMAQVGLQIDFATIARMPNTQRAHQLLALANQRLSAPRFEELLERLFAAHFFRGEDIGSEDLLCSIAEEVGLDTVVLRYWMESGREMPDQWSASAVPTFVFNNTLTLSGSHRPCALLAAMHSRQKETAELY